MTTTVQLLGVPWDGGSSHVRGAAAAPAAVRRALHDPASNWYAECGRSLADSTWFGDAGDLVLPSADGAAAHDAIVRGARALVEDGTRVLAIGGDHSVSFPLVEAHLDHVPQLDVVQIDAHPDLYDDFDGNPFSHASGFARIMESGRVRSLTQIGIRASTAHQNQQAERFGVRMYVEPPVSSALPNGPTYLSIDLDALDPAFVPGVAHPEPGGLTTREVLRIVHALPGPIVGADIVELVPHLDDAGATARVAAKLVKELAARLAGEA